MCLDTPVLILDMLVLLLDAAPDVTLGGGRGMGGAEPQVVHLDGTNIGREIDGSAGLVVAVT